MLTMTSEAHSHIMFLDPAEPSPARWVEARGVTADSGIAVASLLLEDAIALRHEDRSAEAEPLAALALEILEHEHSAEHPDLASALNILAAIHQDLGNLDAAERLGWRALSTLEETEHGGTAVVRLRVHSMSLLAGIHRGQGLYGASEELYRRALHLAERTFGSESQEVVDLLDGLGALHKMQRR